MKSTNCIGHSSLKASNISMNFSFWFMCYVWTLTSILVKTERREKNSSSSKKAISSSKLIVAVKINLTGKKVAKSVKKVENFFVAIFVPRSSILNVWGWAKYQLKDSSARIVPKTGTLEKCLGNLKTDNTS